MLKIKAKSILKRATLNKFTDLIYRIFNILKSNIFHLYRFNILLVIATSLALTYYLILVQIKPFSSPFLKSKVLEVLIKKSGKDFAVDDVLISFTSSGLVKLDMINITSSDFSRAMDNSLVDIPKVSFAFPIYRLMSLDFMPSTLLLDDASFVVDSVDNLFDFGAMGGSSNKKQLKKITSLMKSIKAVKISNTSVKVSNKIKGSVSFFVSEAEFRIKSKRSINKISSNISFEVVDSDLESTKIEIDSYCVLTNKSLDGNCRASLSNVDLNIFSKFSNDHNILDKIKSNSFFGIVFTKNGDSKKLSLTSNSEYLNITSRDLFLKPLSLRDLDFNLNYDLSNDSLEMESLEAKIVFKKEEEDALSQYNISKLKSNFIVSGINRLDSSDINIELENVNEENIVNLWPLFLPRQNIRTWVGKHFSSGVMTSGSLNMSLKKDFETSKVKLDSLHATVFMKNTTLNYSNKFPEIKNINTKLVFDKNSMIAYVNSGRVLQSDITKSVARIDNFRNSRLDMHLHTNGLAVDLFKHINHRSKNLIDKFDKIFNSSVANSNVVVKLPLNKKINLKNSFIKISSNVSHIENPFFAGDITLSTKKKQNSYNFKSNINFDRAFTHKKNILGIKKLHSDKMNLSFNLSPRVNNIKLSSLSLMFNNYKKVINSSLLYNNKTNKLEKFYFKNSGFGNDYVFHYGFNGTLSKFSLKGDSLIMTPQEKTKSKSELSPFAPLDIFHVRNFDLKVDIASLNNSDLESTDIALKLKCKNYLCKKGLFISKYQNGKSILTDFTITRDSKDSYKVTGNVNDVGYFAELYNISANIKDGRIYFDVNQELNHKSNEVIYEGNMKLKSDITIYENSALKALDADDMFLAIKGKIFSNNKTIFSRIKSEFIISPRLSIVNIKSLIANNLKIGITSKGYYDYNSGNARFTGAIIPGYLINNLFGIGNIPIVGNVVSGILTGSKDSGLFGLSYEYKILSHGKKAKFKTFPVKSFVPSSIQSLF